MEENKYRKRFISIVFALLAMPIIAVVALALMNGRPAHKADEKYGYAPKFSLTERSGKEISETDLKGKVWVANFVFSRCSTQCPFLSQEMLRVQELFQSQPHFMAVSFAVDPENDTPTVLKKYARKFKADEEKWLFLTGNRDEMKSVVEKGFKVAGGFESGDAGMLTHTSNFVLVNRYGQIQGYYDIVNDKKAFAQLTKDTRRLLLKRF